MAAAPRLFQLAEWGRVGLGLAFPSLPLQEPMARRIEPPFCRQCGEPYDGALFGEFLCSNCREREWSLAWGRSPYRAEGAVREAIHAFKYRQQFHVLRTLADWLEDGYRQFAAGERWDALVAVPLHPVRHRTRGFNQSEELCRVLGRRQGIPVLRCLKRVRPTPKQAWLSRGPRLRNLLGAFEFKRRFDVEGRRLLVIDDVFTTGATAEACARILVSQGASRVAALTIARA